MSSRIVALGELSGKYMPNMISDVTAVDFVQRRDKSNGTICRVFRAVTLFARINLFLVFHLLHFAQKIKDFAVELLFTQSARNLFKSCEPVLTGRT